MMRRKFPKKAVDPNAPVVPPQPGSGASLPPRPKELNEAAAALSKELGISVAAGHGFGDEPKNPRVPREGTWRLFAFTNDEAAVIPKEYRGFPVSRRSIPVAQSGPAWGKMAKG